MQMGARGGWREEEEEEGGGELCRKNTKNLGLFHPSLPFCAATLWEDYGVEAIKWTNNRQTQTGQYSIVKHAHAPHRERESKDRPEELGARKGKSEIIQHGQDKTRTRHVQDQDKTRQIPEKTQCLLYSLSLSAVLFVVPLEGAGNGVTLTLTNNANHPKKYWEFVLRTTTLDEIALFSFKTTMWIKQ
jgi:hypothetical protein